MGARVDEQIADVMELLESIPQGGVGPSGASMAEIEAAENAGHSVEDDAVYHVVQKSWLLLREALKQKASPDLLAACVKVSDAIDDYMQGGQKTVLVDAYKQVSEAISKAVE